jgi:hypothetical protein
MRHPLEVIREALMNSYKHRSSPDTSCAACGEANHTFAFHLIDYSIRSSEPLPPGFVAMSASGGITRGTFPFCNSSLPTTICNVGPDGASISNSLVDGRSEHTSRVVFLLQKQDLFGASRRADSSAPMSYNCQGPARRSFSTT